MKITLKYQERQTGKTTKLKYKASKCGLKNKVLVFLITPPYNGIQTYDEYRIPTTNTDLFRILVKSAPEKVFLDEFAFYKKGILRSLIKYCVKNNISVYGLSTYKPHTI